MKTATEWSKEIWASGCFNGEGAATDEEELNMIKQIQLDAYKQGLTDASAVCDDGNPARMQAAIEIDKLHDKATTETLH